MTDPSDETKTTKASSKPAPKKPKKTTKASSKPALKKPKKTASPPAPPPPSPDPRCRRCRESNLQCDGALPRCSHCVAACTAARASWRSETSSAPEEDDDEKGGGASASRSSPRRKRRRRGKGEGGASSASPSSSAPARYKPIQCEYPPGTTAPRRRYPKRRSVSRASRVVDVEVAGDDDEDYASAEEEAPPSSDEKTAPTVEDWQKWEEEAEKAEEAAAATAAKSDGDGDDEGRAGGGSDAVDGGKTKKSPPSSSSSTSTRKSPFERALSSTVRRYLATRNVETSENLSKIVDEEDPWKVSYLYHLWRKKEGLQEEEEDHPSMASAAEGGEDLSLVESWRRDVRKAEADDVERLRRLRRRRRVGRPSQKLERGGLGPTIAQSLPRTTTKKKRKSTTATASAMAALPPGLSSTVKIQLDPSDLTVSELRVVVARLSKTNPESLGKIVADVLGLTPERRRRDAALAAAEAAASVTTAREEEAPFSPPAAEAPSTPKTEELPAPMANVAAELVAAAATADATDFAGPDAAFDNVKAEPVVAPNATETVDEDGNVVVAIKEQDEEVEEVDPHEERWEQKFAELAAFHRHHGHVKSLDSTRPLGSKSLCNWLGKQRAQYKRYVVGRSTLLTAEQVRRLDELAPDWTETQVHTWDAQYRKLVQYKSEHGNCRVTAKCGDKKLSNWVTNQRKFYKQFKDGKKTFITADRVRLLDEIGFEMSADAVQNAAATEANERRWNERFEELRKYAEENGDGNVPRSYKNRQLAVWVKKQRELYRKYVEGEPCGGMDDRRVSLMEGLNFVWNARPGYVPSNKNPKATTSAEASKMAAVPPPAKWTADIKREAPPGLRRKPEGDEEEEVAVDDNGRVVDAAHFGPMGGEGREDYRAPSEEATGEGGGEEEHDYGASGATVDDVAFSC